METRYTFSEITGKKELEMAFRLRYEEYLHSRMHCYLEKNESQVDIDVYDLHSKHYGLFLNGQELVGYIRVVLDPEECFNEEVSALGKHFGLFSGEEHTPEKLNESPVADFPFLSYPKVSPGIKALYTGLKKKKEGFAEASRMIISRDHRGMKLFVFIMECAMMLFIRISMSRKNAMIHCCRDHGLYYKRYGFRPFNNEEGYEEFGMHKMLLCMPASASPLNLPAKLYALAGDFGERGEISRIIH